MEEADNKPETEFESDLASYLSSCAGAGSYRVVRELKSSDFEVTEKVMFLGRDGGELGPFVRKRIDAGCGLGGAYELLLCAQRRGLRCAGLPRVLDCWGDGERLNVVMEWLPGVTLEEFVHAHGPSGELARAVAPQLAEAVGLLHAGLGASAPVIHRDLKPSNVMVTGGEDGLPQSFVLIDLGIARTWREGAAADTMRLGTRSYAPPEQFGFGQTGVRSDVYALGATLWFCLAGRDPDPAEVAAAGRAAEKSGGLETVIARAMSLDPEQRFSSAGELARAVAGGEAVAVRPVRPVRREVPAAVGRTWNALLAVVAVVLVVACWVNVVAPAGSGSGAAWPLWYRVLAFGLWMPASFASIAFALADRRRLAQSVGLGAALAACAGVCLGGLVVVALIGALFSVVWGRRGRSRVLGFTPVCTHLQS